MKNDDYDDPQIEEAWCNERRQDVRDYLRRQGVMHGEIGEWPAWHVVPYVSIWAIESRVIPGAVGWWVICGDLPTDYVSAAKIKHPREAMAEFGKRWAKIIPYLQQGKPHPKFAVRMEGKRRQLAPLLKARAKLLSGWAKDETLWDS
jgi:hypothetical protein